MLPIEPTKSSLRGEKRCLLRSVSAVRKTSVCTQAHTLVSIESDYQCVTTTVDPRSSQATVNNKLNKNNYFI